MLDSLDLNIFLWKFDFLLEEKLKIVVFLSTLFKIFNFEQKTFDDMLISDFRACILIRYDVVSDRVYPCQKRIRFLLDKSKRTVSGRYKMPVLNAGAKCRVHNAQQGNSLLPIRKL